MKSAILTVLRFTEPASPDAGNQAPRWGFRIDDAGKRFWHRSEAFADRTFPTSDEAISAGLQCALSINRVVVRLAFRDGNFAPMESSP